MSNKKDRRSYFLLAAVFLVMGWMLSAPIFADGGESKQVIRVGFPIQAGLTELDSEGNYTGYTYEYLQELSQYTGWEYQFVEAPGDMNESLTTLLNKLENGEIDLMGAMNYNEQLAEIYDYPGQSYGTVYTVLYALYENASLSKINYQSQQVLRIAILEGAKTRLKELDDFCTMNKISYTTMECKNEEEQLQALKENKADALLDVSLNHLDGVRIVASFAPRPFYFATTPGRQDIVQEINSAILSINEADPYFATTLHEKYFNPTMPGVILSNEDQEYIQNADTLRVGMLVNKAPFQYQDEKTGEMKGISLDLLDYIRKETGLEFEIVPIKSQEEQNRLLEEGQIDLIAGMIYDYDIAREHQVALTRPYATTQYIMVMNGRTTEENLLEQTIALPLEYEYQDQLAEQEGILWYNSLEECISAVNDGKAALTYGNGYSVQYYINNPKFRNVHLVPQTNSTYKLCIGVTRPSSKALLSILNKAVISISEDEMQSIVYQNTTNQREFSFLSILEANPVQSIGILFVFAFCIIGIMAWNLHSRTKMNRQISMDIKKYNQVYELANEHFFEYDFNAKKMMISIKNEVERSNVAMIDWTLDQFPNDKIKAKQLELLYAMLQSREDGTEEVYFPVGEDQFRWLSFTFKTVCDDLGRPAYVIGKIVDIDDEKREKEALRLQAQRDSLTNLYNAAACRNMITEKILTLPKEKQGVLLILDVDYFKSINDEFGHFTGDSVLISVANALVSIFRQGDVVGRMGGDEFMVYMENVNSHKEMADKCEQLCERIRAIKLPDPDKRISASVGATVVLSGGDYDLLYQKADKALYEAKKNGRDRYEIA